MRAAIFDGPGKTLRIDRIADPAPGPGELVVKTHRCGICGTDLHMTEGHGMTYPAPCVLGHEFAGEVVALGSGAGRHAIGDRVAVLPFWACGACPACMAGKPNLCVPYEMIGIGAIPGGYAEYTIAKQACCLELPDQLGYDEGALAEPLAVSLRGIRMAGITSASRVLVIGAGPIGLAAAFWARYFGASRVAVMAPSERRRELATHMGADAFVLLDDRAEAAAGDALGGAPSVVIECVGQPGMIEQAIALAGVGATVVVLGFCIDRDSIMPAAAVMKELNVRFSMVYDIADYSDVLATLASGERAPLAMITDRIGLDALPQAFDALRGRTSQCKVMIDPWAEMAA